MLAQCKLLVTVSMFDVDDDDGEDTVEMDEG